MKSISKLIVLFLSVAFLTSTQSSTSLAKSSLNSVIVGKIVDQYYENHAGSSLDRPPRCPPRETSSCVDVACEKLGQFGCDDMEEIKAVTRACRGNDDGHCLRVVCGKLGQFGCDQLLEIQGVARACIGNDDTSCFESTCQRLGQFGCDELSEVQDVLRSCAGQ